MSIVRYRTTALMKFNISSYLEREFINSGLYFNVGSGQFDANGNRMDTLTRVTGSNYESFTNNWIYEPDASGAASFPTVVASGVTIDGVFHTIDAGPHKPVIDYDNGRILFNGTEVNVNSTVEAIFSYKHVAIDFPESNKINWIFSNIKDNTVSTLHTYPSGNQRQLPIIIIDLQDRTHTRGLELGGGTVRDQRVVFHVLTNNEDDRDTIIDILEAQHRKVFQGVNYNTAPQLLTYQGDKSPTYSSFTNLQGSNKWVKIYVDDARIVENDEFYNMKRSRVDWRITTYHGSVN